VLTTLAIENYRSLRRLTVPLERLNLVVGANGTGKSSLYRALRLLAGASRNGAVAALAREGGLASTLWAGPESTGRAVREGTGPVQGTVRKNRVALRLGFAGDTFGYAIDLGLPVRSAATAFTLDPEVKAESVWGGPVLRPSAVLTERRGQHVRIRNTDGSWADLNTDLQPFDSMLSELADPQRTPELLALREQIRSWRFYDHFRSDAEAPARTTQIGTRTPVLSDDGSDLAAALQTTREIGDAESLDDAVEHAFPGSRLEIVDQAGRFDLHLHQHGLLRPLSSAELSDGTLRYLLWAAALLSPRPPALLVLNEPETSLHPDLQPALARLVVTAARRTQLVVVSHSDPLIAAIDAAAGDGGVSWQAIELTKDLGETRVKGQDNLHGPTWQWPRR
jgi:predicted ATPase